MRKTIWLERARPDLRRRVNVGAPVQQQPHDLDVVILRRDVEARGPILGRPQGCEDMWVRGTLKETEEEKRTQERVESSDIKRGQWDREDEIDTVLKK